MNVGANGAGSPAAAAPTVATEEDLKVAVIAKERAAEGVVMLTLAPADGRELPPWIPGAHLDLRLAPGLDRQYSLCGSPAVRQAWQIAVLREPRSRGGSAYIHDRLMVGDLLSVRGPRNHFRLETSRRYIFVAGGIGITPIVPMVAAVAAKGAQWRLLYGGRHRNSMAFRGLLGGYGDQVQLWPQDQLGLLPLDEVLGTPQSDTLVYCCGPEALLTAVEQRCAAWPAGALHVERFTAKEIARPPRQLSFRVVCRRSGLTVEVPPDRSVLEVLEQAGVPVTPSCREGTCGSCETDVLSGRPDHRDSVLSPAEQESGRQMMICVSRSLDGELVLDI
jgi:ferredoxin-NADP reductase